MIVDSNLTIKTSLERWILLYQLLEDYRFRINHYHQASPFSSFLPGLAGEDGIPMWIFYVNRGQAIASFGVENKDNAMTEFYPADKAYQTVPLQGFRTFIKGSRYQESFTYEPFNEIDSLINDSMTIDDNILELCHENKRDQLKLDVAYYNLPHQSIPGLIREVTITNQSDQQLDLELVDGLATLFPANVENGSYKSISHTLKSWFDVKLIDQSFNYYFLRGSTADEASVSQDEKGNFYHSLLKTNRDELVLTPLFDRRYVFGNDLSLRQPEFFNHHDLDQLSFANQVSTNQVACGFTPVKYHFAEQETIKLYTIIGQVNQVEEARQFINQHVSIKKLSDYRIAASKLAKVLTNRVETKTSLPLFDGYVKQNYLDNGLRGGFPFIFENELAKQVFYLYSRKHGDLERDYNFFSISPSYYSQGNGNYRDMNQNRRLDVLLDPRIEDSNIRKFVDLIQLDGYNPLSIKTVQFSLKDPQFDLNPYGIPPQLQITLKELLINSYTPGMVKQFLVKENVELIGTFEKFLTDLLTVSDESLEAEHGDGFWIDHWTYNLDLIDSYLAVYPDRKNELYFTVNYRFFDSPARVNRQVDKFVKDNQLVRQYNAVLIDERKQTNNQWLKTNYGTGEVFTTNLFSKLFLLATTKVATIAPYGLGIEMEAGKPGWNDALNGLPGMFGSGVSELYELKRLLTQLQFNNQPSSAQISLPIEVKVLIEFLFERLCPGQQAELNLDLWKDLTLIRETYREAILLGISGERYTQTFNQARKIIDVFKQFVDQAINAVETFHDNLVPTYFYFDVALSDDDALIKHVRPHAVLPFLEGVVKQLKLTKDREKAKEIYLKVKQSDLYDEKLGMYKTSVSIKPEPIELGRAKFFTPGWLENESIFLHMSYKYLLALLKSGLYNEFFREIKTGLVMFNDPVVYGRNPLENSSFIVSSANPDQSIHGKGYIARLSGSTVEFLNMWFEMFVGHKPFASDNQTLSFKLDPKLPDWLFDENGVVQFKLFSKIIVTYRNISRRNTYGEDRVKPIRYICLLDNNEEIVIEGPVILGSLAERVRTGSIKSIQVDLR